MKQTITVITVVLLITLAGCKPNKQKENTSKNMEMPKITKPVENIEATPEQRERRNKSEDICKAHDVPVYVNPNSLFVETDEKVTIRSKDEVVDRALALLYIGLKSEGLEQKYLDQIEKEYGIKQKLSEKEKDYAFAPNATEQQKTDANWRYESLHVMLWALGFIDQLVYPDQMCDVASDVKIIHGLSEKQFRDKARLRSKSEILDQADLILRLDWACVSAKVANKPAPGHLDKSVVYERHYSLNWLINYLNQYWDDVSADT